jgi:hypothetical protein
MKKFVVLIVILFCCRVNVTAVELPGKTLPADSKLLSDWIALQLTLIRTTKGITQGHVTRQFTLNSIVFYECLRGSDTRYRSLSGQLQQLDKTPQVPENLSAWAASANAGYGFMLRTFFGNDNLSKRKIDSLESLYTSRFAAEGLSNSAIQVATEYGRTVAVHILKWSKGDGSEVVYPPYEIPKGTGNWEPTPPGRVPPAAPQMVHFRSCIKGSSDNSLPPAPMPFSIERTSPFYKMVKEVYDVQAKLTPEQKSIALFWDDLPDGKYYGGVGHWCSILRQVLEKNKTGLMQGAEAFVKMTIASSDAQLACWKGKYAYNVLRPITYINRYMNSPDWVSLIVTPNHPEYPAAHATVSTAAATALTDALGQSVSFTDHTYDDIGFQPRSFTSFEEAAIEAGRSRLYGGIHYIPSIEAGHVLGKKTATAVLTGMNIKDN